jgi:nucleoside transporter
MDANRIVNFRLSIMMFLQFFIWGAWWVSLGPYMATERIGMAAIIFMAYLSQPIAAMISPFFLGMVADRFFPSEKVLAVLHLLGALFLVVVPFFGEMDGGRTLFITFIILHMLCYMPTIGLTNTVAFNTMNDPENQFPIIRVWGTIGWIISNLVVGVAFAWILATTPEHTPWPFYLAAASALIMAIYSLSLPHTPPRLKGQKAKVKQILGIDAVKKLSSKEFWVFMIASLLICIPLAGYYTYAATFADHAGLEREVLGWTVGVTAWMSTGQMTEVIFMLLMPLAFRAFGIKWMLLAGMGAWVLRYALFAFGAPDEIFWMILVGIALHGICYDFFFVAGMIYVEKKSTADIRAQAQGFLVQMTLGIGMFIGMLVMGPLMFNTMVDGLTGAERMQAYQLFWAIPAVLAFLVMVFFAWQFHDPEVEQEILEDEEAE